MDSVRTVRQQKRMHNSSQCVAGFALLAPRLLPSATGRTALAVRRVWCFADYSARGPLALHAGGGDVMRGNLIANCVRESGDHGPFNSWDRLPYITTASGKPSVIPLVRQIEANLIVST
jgi:hypothetical protein